MKKPSARTKGAVSCVTVSLTVLMLSNIVSDKTFGYGDLTDGDGSVIFSGPALPADAEPPAVAFADSAPEAPVSRAADPGAKPALRSTDLNALFAARGYPRVVTAGKPSLRVDNAYVRAEFGRFDLEGGLLKVSWGTADGHGPLDVVNPLDLSDLSKPGSLARKIARPMLHASYEIDEFSKVECVIIPLFEGNQFATEGRWVPAQIKNLPVSIIESFPARERANARAYLSGIDLASLYPETTRLDYAQGGIRYTTKAGKADLGFQYYCGNLPEPAISVDTQKILAKVSSGAISIDYNRYSQIGADFAATLGKYGVRGEIAANITSDLEGDDGAVYNPAFLWLFGFDRDVFAGVKLNAQAAGSVRLLNDRIGDTITDSEAGTDMTSTTVTVIVSKRLLTDELKLRATALYDIEENDFLLMPAFTLTEGTTEFELCCGLFEGNPDGEFGQYDDNDYLRLTVTRSF